MTGILTATVGSLLTFALSSGDAGEAPLRVRVQLPAGVHYVGESLNVTVAVLAEGERPELKSPRSPSFDFALVETDLQPVSASGIGDVVGTTNLFRYRYRLIAKKAGNLELPAITARTKDRSGSSGPLRLKVVDVPQEQRPREFLGGVGAFELTAEAVPETVRVGQTLEYRIRLTGPAARSSRSVPSLPLPGKSSIQPEVEVMNAESVADPPSCVFRYRLRPRRAGEAVLPPVAIAAFDPRSARFVTKVTPGILVRVVAVPPITPADIQYGMRQSAASAPQAQRIPPALSYLGVGLILAALALLVRLNRGRTPGPGLARSAAARRARELLDHEPPALIARQVMEGLLEYLSLATDRAGGALTPQEAEEGVFAATADRELAGRTGRLVECCDRACYGPGGVSPEELSSGGRGVLGDLGQRPLASAAVRKTKRGSPDREAG
ncbi:MAG: BatD family protein [Isosphaeraceae bacterium]|nr:BatD family protein [Isosphaeraceae bacterium]